jgi:hypothetical protein
MLRLPFYPLTLSLFRPLARRRFNTSWPPLVAIRARNPWVFFRLLLLGWNVLFMIFASPAEVSQNEGFYRH